MWLHIQDGESVDKMIPITFGEIQYRKLPKKEICDLHQDSTLTTWCVIVIYISIVWATVQFTCAVVFTTGLTFEVL